MNNRYIYDVEIYPNMFMVTFIPEDISDDLIDAYVLIDKKHIVYQKENLDDTEILKDKQSVLQLMKARQFIIWLDYKSGEWKNDAPLLMDFFIQHKILTGYNSNNYDQYMLDIFINNYRYLDHRGFNKKEGKHITQILFDHSSKCVEFGTGYGRLLDFKKYYKKPFTDYDIQKILYLDKTFTSLKQVAICLKWHRIQNLPIEFDKPIKEDEVAIIADYNINDVLITLQLVRNQKSELELREDISNEFGIDVRNMSRSSIGKAITTELYEKFSGIDRKDFINTKTDRWRISVNSVLSDRIQFKTQVLNDLLRKIRQQVIVVGSDKKEDKFKHEFKFGNTIYTMALGGLHSQDQPTIFDTIKDNNTYILRDADVASYYPNGILSFDVYPKHLERKPFRATVGYTKDTRVEAKHTSGKLGKEAKIVLNDSNLAKSQNRADAKELEIKYNDLIHQSKKFKTKAEGLKIAINRMYGAFRDINDYLYDPKCTYKVTINLQLCLLMLIEALELKGIQVISANTDGIVCKIYPEQEQDYIECCEWWQQYNNFELEFTNYEKYFRNDVNNYIAIKEGFTESLKQLSNLTEKELHELEENYIKRKGLFIEDISFNKGYQYPVVPKALNAFLIYNIPYTEFIDNYIKNKDAIYDYCMSQKTDSKFNIIYRHLENGKLVDDVLQKSNRFYISDVGFNSGTIIKIDKANPKKINRIVAKFSVTPFNDFIQQDDYHLDFAFYKKECSKILYGKDKKTSGVVTLQGDLFGNITTNNDLKLDEYNEDDGLYEVSFEDDDMQFENPSLQIPINNTKWGMLGYTSEEDYLKDIESGKITDLPF